MKSVKTYLYNRVSSGKQNSGRKDGLTRQSESAEVLDFIKRHKLTVVKTMEYIGSSFTGKNFDNGTVMGKFVEETKSGKIPVPVATEESRGAAVTARPATVAKFKSLMAGVDYEAFDLHNTQMHVSPPE